jgi:hypothetical protein
LSGLAGAIAVILLPVSGAPESMAMPAPEELAPNTVVLVSNVPVRRGTITRAEFQHGLVLTAVAAGFRSAPRPGAKGYERLKERTVHSLLEAVWVYGEAAERDIAVTPSEVARKLALIKRQSFESAAEYRRFLKESRYTRRDVNERVELQLLSARLQRRIIRPIERESRNRFEEQQAIREFVTEFNARWRGRTVCAPEYATDLCSTWTSS